MQISQIINSKNNDRLLPPEGESPFSPQKERQNLKKKNVENLVSKLRGILASDLS